MPIIASAFPRRAITKIRIQLRSAIENEIDQRDNKADDSKSDQMDDEQYIIAGVAAQQNTEDGDENTDGNYGKSETLIRGYLMRIGRSGGIGRKLNLTKLEVWRFIRMWLVILSLIVAG